MEKSFEFSYCLDEVEYIEDNENITESEGEDVVMTLIKNNKIVIGERTKGKISFNDSSQPIVYHLDYEYCSRVGVDYYDDEWETREDEVLL